MSANNQPTNKNLKNNNLRNILLHSGPKMEKIQMAIKRKMSKKLYCIHTMDYYSAHKGK